MKIEFDKNAGETIDLFWSLYYLTNYGYVRSEYDRLGLELNSEIEKVIESLAANQTLDMERVRFFFDRETKISEALLGIDETFGKTLEECLIEIESFSEKTVIKRLVHELSDISSADSDSSELSTITEARDFLDLIKGLHISPAAKWNLFAFSENIGEYIKEFLEIVRQYAHVYYKELNKHRKVINQFYKGIEGRIEKDSTRFLIELSKETFRPDDYETINLTVTYLYAYNLYFKPVGNNGRLILGIEFERVLKRLGGLDEIESNLLIFKNLSDKTRFEIIRLLVKKKYFGQEIADILGITTATVSYHMNFLFASRMVEVERSEHKVYYSLNKDTMRHNIEFLNRELKLEQ